MSKKRKGLDRMKEYIGTVIVGALLLAAVAFVIVKMIKDKKSGKSSCGCNCPGCSGGKCPCRIK